VTAHFNRNSASLGPLVDEYGPDRLQTASCDLTDEKAVVAYFSSISSNKGPVSILIVNHAIYKTEHVPFEDMSLDQWTSTLDSNLTSSFLVAREYLRQLKEASEKVKTSASIMFIGSTAGIFGEAYHADYSASKSGKLTLSLSIPINY